MRLRGRRAVPVRTTIARRPAAPRRRSRHRRFRAPTRRSRRRCRRSRLRRRPVIRLPADARNADTRAGSTGGDAPGCRRARRPWERSQHGCRLEAGRRLLHLRQSPVRWPSVRRRIPPSRQRLIQRRRRPAVPILPGPRTPDAGHVVAKVVVRALFGSRTPPRACVQGTVSHARRCESVVQGLARRFDLAPLCEMPPVPVVPWSRSDRLGRRQ